MATRNVFENSFLEHSNGVIAFESSGLTESLTQFSKSFSQIGESLVGENFQLHIIKPVASRGNQTNSAVTGVMGYKLKCQPW